MVFIGIVDDKKNICGALKERINRMEGYEVVFTAENGHAFLEAMRQAQLAILPDVVLMDIDMPVMNGIEAVAEGKLRYPNTKYLMLTIFDEDDKIFAAIKAGADGYLLKDETVDHILESVNNLLKNEGAPMSPSIARKVLNLLADRPKNALAHQRVSTDLDYKLTDREKEILELLVEGLEYKEIAKSLCISPNTVRNNVTKIYSKLHVSTRMQAVRVMRNS